MQEVNTDKLAKFIDTLNGKDQTNHLVTAHPGPLLSEVLLSSPILAGEDGAPLAPMGQGFEFGIDPTEDPELAMVCVLVVATLSIFSLSLSVFPCRL